MKCISALFYFRSAVGLLVVEAGQTAGCVAVSESETLRGLST